MGGSRRARESAADEMVKQIHVEGFEAFQKVLEEYSSQQNTEIHIFALFCGSKSKDGEDSWCPDCVTAEPVIEKNLQFAPEGAVLIRCGVGTREFWKDQNNVFRKDNILKLKSVPTLLKINTPQRLEEVQCANDQLVKMFFEED